MLTPQELVTLLLNCTSPWWTPEGTGEQTSHGKRTKELQRDPRNQVISWWKCGPVPMRQLSKLNREVNLPPKIHLMARKVLSFFEYVIYWTHMQVVNKSELRI